MGPDHVDVALAQVRRANIPDDLREQFELYGEPLLVALGVCTAFFTIQMVLIKG